MTTKHSIGEVQMIPVDMIDVLNPRERNAKIFSEIVANIDALGIKKPIKVTPRDTEHGKRYLLVCGEGRLAAHQTLHITEIPSLVVDVSDEDAFLMSLAENIARRQSRPLEILAGIGQLKEKGYTPKNIAAKTGLTMQYVQGILTLLEQGEERLLIAVEKGNIPLNAALTIVGVGDDDKAMQSAMQDAYESGELRGKQLMEVRRIVEKRKVLGRSVSKSLPRKQAEPSASSLVRTYRREVDRQKLLVKKAAFVEQCLLRELGHTEAPCLIAKDDESYTYNARINRISTIQEHYMIRRAIDRGVSPNRLAIALGIDVSTIHRKATLLEGVCKEAAELLKDREFTTNVSRVLRLMKPLRQVECVELMTGANNLTTTYADALLAATPADMLVDGKKPKKRVGLTQEEMSRMEREMANVQGQYKLAVEDYGQDVLNQQLARAYLAKLLENKDVIRYLKQQYSEVLEQFKSIVETTSLDQ